MAIGQSGEVDLARDRDLVERAQLGDESAFADLYLLYRDRLYRTCLGKLGSRPEAEDVVQESFARAFKALPGLAGERKFYPWLSVIASHLCVDLARQKGRLTTLEEENLTLSEPAGGSEAERLVESREREELLETALRRISPRHREVLELREQRKWSYRRIAAHAGVEVSTIETLLYRARRSLRRELISLTRTGGPLGVLLLPFAVARVLARRLRHLAAVTVGKLSAVVAAAPGSTLGGAAAATVTAVVLTASAVVGAHPGGGSAATAHGGALPALVGVRPAVATTPPSDSRRGIPAHVRAVPPRHSTGREAAAGHHAGVEKTDSPGHAIAGAGGVLSGLAAEGRNTASALLGSGGASGTVSSVSRSVSRTASSLPRSAGAKVGKGVAVSGTVVSGARSGLSHLAGGLGVVMGGGGLLSGITSALPPLTSGLSQIGGGLGSTVGGATPAATGLPAEAHAVRRRSTVRGERSPLAGRK